MCVLCYFDLKIRFNDSHNNYSVLSLWERKNKRLKFYERDFLKAAKLIPDREKTIIIFDHDKKILFFIPFCK